jgi:hypothetical protein
MSGFWTKTPGGETIHINGDPNMSEETAQALGAVMDTLVKRFNAMEKSFNHVWDQPGNKDGISKEQALWWFRAGADWQVQQEINRKANAKA